MADTALNRAVANGGTLLFRLLRSLVAAENGEIRCCGVTTGQGLALLAMEPGGQVTMRQVAGALGVSAGTATRVVDNLVRDGLVERTANPGDRRNVCVRPTARGDRTIKELEECNCLKLDERGWGVQLNRLYVPISTEEVPIWAIFYSKAELYTCSLGHEHIDFLKEDFDALMVWITLKCSEPPREKVE